MEVPLFPENPTTELRRGIAPSLLIQQVKNTAPFIFEGPISASLGNSFLTYVRHVDQILQTSSHPEKISWTHEQYFEICLSAHHTTVATFVPTDVDNQIRFKLWHPNLNVEVISKMAFLVIKSLVWDSRSVSTRWITSPDSGEILSGHHGEWLSTAVAAYGALKKKQPDLAADIAGLIIREIQRESQIFQDLKKARDGIGVLKASTLIAHNLGDLDRVIEMWNLANEDPLRDAVYKAGHTEKTTAGTALLKAGDLNKSFMAIENHRHFALRTPRCLRRSSDLLLPIGPFFDEWGMQVAKHPKLKPEEVGQVVEALVDGWMRLQQTVGYSRALAGIIETFPGGFSALKGYLPARTSRMLKSGTLHSLSSIPKKRFEDHWKQIALRTLN